MRLAVAGTGYVGLSNAVLLSQNHNVVAVDVMQEKVDMINRRESPIADPEIESFFQTKKLNLVATTDAKTAYRDADIIIIATPTNYDPETNAFDTNSVEQVIESVLRVNKNALIVIKSTIPVGYTKRMRERFDTDNLI